MHKLTIKYQDKIYKQFVRSRPIDFSVWGNYGAQTYHGYDNEVFLTLQSKPEICHDLMPDSDRALIFIQ